MSNILIIHTIYVIFLLIKIYTVINKKKLEINPLYCVSIMKKMSLCSHQKFEIVKNGEHNETNIMFLFWQKKWEHIGKK